MFSGAVTVSVLSKVEIVLVARPASFTHPGGDLEKLHKKLRFFEDFHMWFFRLIMLWVSLLLLHSYCVTPQPLTLSQSNTTTYLALNRLKIPIGIALLKQASNLDFTLTFP